MKNKKNCLSVKRGSILAYSLIILAVMLAIAVSISVSSVAEKKSASSTQFSMQSIQTADAGAQLAVKSINSVSSGTISVAVALAGLGGSCVDSKFTSDDDASAGPIGSLYELTFFGGIDGTSPLSCTNNVDELTKIKSIGTYKDTVRVVEVSVGCNIRTCQDLQDIGRNSTTLTRKYALCGDLDCSGFGGANGFLPIGNQITPFQGKFDGGGFKIKNLNIVDSISAQSKYGLFGSISSADVKNIGVENITINVKGGFVGGVVGVATSSFVSNVYSSGSVNISLGSCSVGGVVGRNASFSNVSKSHSDMQIIFTGATHAGGLVGHNDNSSSIDNSFSAGNAIKIPLSSGGEGGLVGLNSIDSIITNSYAFNVYDGLASGGLVSTIYNPGATTNSYWDKQLTGRTTSASGTGKTTSEMKQQATYAGWDFVNTWKIIPTVNDGYPCLVGVTPGCN